MLLFYLNVSVHTASAFPAFLNIQFLTLYLPLLTIQKDSVTTKKTASNGGCVLMLGILFNNNSGDDKRDPRNRIIFHRIGQIIRGKMRIGHCLLYGGVSENPLQRDDIAAVHHEVCGERMP